MDLEENSVSTFLHLIFVLFSAVLLAALRVPFCSSDALPGYFLHSLLETVCAKALLCSFMLLSSITSHLHKHEAHISIQKLNFNVFFRFASPTADI